MSSPFGQQNFSTKSAEVTPASEEPADLNKTIYEYSAEEEMEEEEIVAPVVSSPTKNETPEKRMMGFNIQKSPSQKQQDYIQELRRTIMRQGKTISDLEFDKDHLEEELKRKNETIKNLERTERMDEELEEGDEAGMRAELNKLKKKLEKKKIEALELKDVVGFKDNEIENLRNELAKKFKSTGEAPPLFSAFSKQIDEEVTTFNNTRSVFYNVKDELARTKEELQFANQQISMIIETNELEKAELVSRNEEEKKGMEERIEELNKTIQLMSQW
ncbi:hypothetical protein GCK72_015999 [Caenorhabditis remanei]|uniref:Uncharacterized protein n=1 Tax=Caenorhabditis remanei TaxID=31234 RepID=A0A6A5GZ06_CAERE|nr:hypothetical protein GCK72_015999 [Caenorhabditis remanei]KAF1759532.1 hypothetical protein GCK72_015999 [Caenorhabditis remanei]